MESLTPKPGIREQHRPNADIGHRMKGFFQQLTRLIRWRVLSWVCA
jgi:hypothetical protein